MMENKKSELHKLIDLIEDDSVLQMVKEDIQYYTKQTDILNELDEPQRKELNDAIAEAGNEDVIDWKDFKKEMDEWKRR